jgi:hypothetical protein
MMPVGFWKFLHLFSSLSLIACVMSAYWNVLAARRVDDWGRRFALFEATRRASLRYALPSVLLIGIFANLTAVSLGLRLATDPWVRWIDGMWFAAVVVLALVTLPASRALVREARRAVDWGQSRAFDRALVRWRFSNATLVLLSVASIGLMVFRWRN